MPAGHETLRIAVRPRAGHLGGARQVQALDAGAAGRLWTWIDGRSAVRPRLARGDVWLRIHRWPLPKTAWQRTHRAVEKSGRPVRVISGSAPHALALG